MESYPNRTFHFDRSPPASFTSHTGSSVAFQPHMDGIDEMHLAPGSIQTFQRPPTPTAMPYPHKRPALFHEPPPKFQTPPASGLRQIGIGLDSTCREIAFQGLSEPVIKTGLHNPVRQPIGWTIVGMGSQPLLVLTRTDVCN